MLKAEYATCDWVNFTDLFSENSFIPMVTTCSDKRTLYVPHEKSQPFEKDKRYWITYNLMHIACHWII